jgi:hypothetical protein
MARPFLVFLPSIRTRLRLRPLLQFPIFIALC